MALTPDQITEILAGTRSRGAGTEYLAQFIESGEAGEEVDLSSGPLAGKEPGAAFTALQNAKKRTKTAPDGSVVPTNPEFGKIQIRKKNHGSKDAPDWHVYVINTELLEQ